ncbi:DNA mismatch repair protein MSH6 [Apostasia shenzhenica]|uniref:DNA mismatch repair protein MSH6 n=1 Tax=Apostasia shenzhenica TaxID=1088818 RepID=A0A2I0AJM3_9ASPA|nr:DNA mismatch repair protein MSH6 [Apostasia shenzhenica]
MDALCYYRPIKNPLIRLFLPQIKLPRPLRCRVTETGCFMILGSAHDRSRLGSLEAKSSVSVSSPGEKYGHSGLENDFRQSGEEAERIRAAEELREETEEALDWRSVCSQVSAFASTATGREVCRNGELPVGRDRRESEKLLNQTAAAVLLSEPLDFSGVDVASDIVRKAVAKGFLTVRELCAVGRSLTSARRIFEQLLIISSMEESSDRYFPLVDILQNCDFLTELANKMSFCIDCNLFVILDRASMRLETVRLERRENIEKLEALLKEESNKVFKAGGVDDPLITKRRTRMCIAVKASHKSLLPEGIVLGMSSSGLTYFMEPKNAIQLNNMEVRLCNAEKAEEIAVMGILTSEIAGSKEKIFHLMEKILELDLACARGAYAQWFDAVFPTFSVDHEWHISNEKALLVDIEGIRHPLLLEPFLCDLSSNINLELRRTRMCNIDDEASETKNLAKLELVPIDIKIGTSTKVIVISGPNTGGKTVTMKTLGLASLMSKAGMFLPAKNKPRLPWFDQVLADIGDHQSLERSLSTFSGHISRLSKILQVTTGQSLILIDEIGNGTDPSEGVAISSSILQHLVECANLVVVTTHYADLSLLKATDSRFENAAMEFCIKTLQPTYRILWGSTGNSNALSIAKSIGFDQHVLYRAQEWAKKLAPNKQMERQDLLYKSLVEERGVLECKAREAASLLSEVKELYLEVVSSYNVNINNLIHHIAAVSVLVAFCTVSAKSFYPLIEAEAQDLSRREATLKASESRNLQQELKSARSQMETVIKNFEEQLPSAGPDQFNLILRRSESLIASIAATHQPTNNTLREGNDSLYVPKIGDRVYVKGLGDKVATVIEAPREDGVAMLQYGKIKVRVKKGDIRSIQLRMKDSIYGTSLQSRQLEKRQQYKKLFTEMKKDAEVSFGPAVRTSKNTVDLRGMRVEDASCNLEMAISAGKSYSVLFIIHGIGSGALKEHAINILRNHPRVVKYEEESPMNHGCTVAYIK